MKRIRHFLLMTELPVSMRSISFMICSTGPVIVRRPTRSSLDQPSLRKQRVLSRCSISAGQIPCTTCSALLPAASRSGAHRQRNQVSASGLRLFQHRLGDRIL